MKNASFAVFVAIAGITSRLVFISGIPQAGLKLFFLGMITTSIPMIVALLIDHNIFKFDPAINLRCRPGARTIPSAYLVTTKPDSSICKTVAHILGKVVVKDLL